MSAPSPWSKSADEFVICCGYKGHVIKEYFANYDMHHSDVTFELGKNFSVAHERRAEQWRVTLIDTGEETMTGGRLRRVRRYLDDNGTFCFTYGDGVADVNISELLAFHRAHGKSATLTAALPPGRFGALALDPDTHQVRSFREKPQGDGGYVSAGFFVLEPSVIDLIDGDDCIWEKQPLEHLATAGELHAFRHDGFWQPMDTLRDKVHLESLWSAGTAPWKVW